MSTTNKLYNKVKHVVETVINQIYGVSYKCKTLK